MYCKNCGEQMNDNQAICLKCGVKTGEGNAFCANCGQPVNPDAEVCLSCGVAVKKTGDFGNYDKITIALICFFLGSFGVHNFMLGENKKGIAKLITLFVIGPITCGIGEIALGILVLVEFIKILTNKYVVDPNKII